MNSVMLEVTRLTRQGRLSEAMALLRAGRAKDSGKDSVGGSSDQLAETMPGASPIDMVRSADGAWRLPPAGSTSFSSASAPVRRAWPAAPSWSGAHQRSGFLGGAGDIARMANNRQPPVSVKLPPGARFEELSFSNAAGHRSYRLYVPGNYNGPPLPLVVMLHGCTQTPEDFAAGTRMNEVAEERGFLVAYPRQPASANSSKCWNWFNPGDQARDRGEPSLIAGITRTIMADFSVDPQKVFVAGLSAGGAAAAIMGEAYPELFAAVGIHSGLACGAASDVSSAFAAMKTGGGCKLPPAPQAKRTIVFHGERDHTVASVNGDEVIARAAGRATLDATVAQGVSSGGIRYRRTVRMDGDGIAILEQWLLHDAGHAWSGGSPEGSYTTPKGPDASREMARFFLGEL